MNLSPKLLGDSFLDYFFENNGIPVTPIVLGMVRGPILE